jgi:hypothetical protein
LPEKASIQGTDCKSAPAGDFGRIRVEIAKQRKCKEDFFMGSQSDGNVNRHTNQINHRNHSSDIVPAKDNIRVENADTACNTVAD